MNSADGLYLPFPDSCVPASYLAAAAKKKVSQSYLCLLYTSDAADE